MKATLQFLRTIQVAMLIAAALYLYLPEAAHARQRPASTATYYSITVLTAGAVIAIFIVRKRWTTPVETLLSTDRENKEALLRLRKGYVLIYALAEAAILYGLMLRFIGFARIQVAPFYIVGTILLLYCFPRNLSSQISLS